MARSVTIAAGQNNVQLPDGNTYNAGQTVHLTDDQFRQVAGAVSRGVLTDNGSVAEPGDEVVTQGTAVTITTGPVPALTSAPPAALTAPATIAATYTAAEVQALRDDVAALRGTVAALQADLTAVHGAATTLRTDVTALDTALSGAGRALA